MLDLSQDVLLRYQIKTKRTIIFNIMFEIWSGKKITISHRLAKKKRAKIF